MNVFTISFSEKLDKHHKSPRTLFIHKRHLIVLEILESWNLRKVKLTQLIQNLKQIDLKELFTAVITSFCQKISKNSKTKDFKN